MLHLFLSLVHYFELFLYFIVSFLFIFYQNFFCYLLVFELFCKFLDFFLKIFNFLLPAQNKYELKKIHFRNSALKKLLQLIDLSIKIMNVYSCFFDFTLLYGKIFLKLFYLLLSILEKSKLDKYYIKVIITFEKWWIPSVLV